MISEAEVGTLLGVVAEGETLAGWEIVATGDGGAITMKSGSCFGRFGDWDGSSETGWDAVTARLWARMSDADVLRSLSERMGELGGADRRIGAEAAYQVTFAEAAKRGLV